ncbi:MAG: VWA domain-containing protein, partial [Polyangiaceae bacterium]|nr:VWA domain-containing protein [Polyangiaceae bacterium]
MTASKWTGTRLEALSARAARLVEAPHEIGGTFEKVFGGLYRFFGWQAKFASKSLRELVDTVRRDGTIEAALLKDAVEETGDNMALAERAVAIHGYVPAAHASWLSRVVETLQRIDHLIEDGSKQAARVLAGVDTTRMLPPLRIQAERAKDDPELETVLEKPDRARLLELQLAAIDHIMEAARSETQVIERRRRLLEGARRLLLDATAALPIDMEGARDRERFLASEITKLDRLQAAGLDAKVAVLYQAKQAVRRGDRDKLHAALVAMDSFALAVGDGAASGFTGRALDELAGGPGRYTERWEDGDHIRESLDRSAEQIFGRRIVSSIAEQYSLARKRFEASDTTNVDAELRSLALDYLAPGSEGEALAALVSVDGCFEVGGALSAVRATELETIARIVAHPTPEMLTMTAHGIEDVRQAVIEDPRTILLDLAAGRLLARKFVQRIQRPVTRTRLVGEARVYVLDGSTSMLSQGLEQSRARMRDAIMVAELATMLRRLEEPGRSVRLSLFYRYFTLKLGELRCVRTPGEVVAALADVVGTPRKGGTDIQAALLSSFA